MLKPLGMECENIVAVLRAVEPFVYVATPYSKYPHGMDAAFVEACRASGWLIANGVRVFCPIAHTHPIAKHSDIPLDSYDIWIPADRPFMGTAGAIVVVMMESWETSYGVGVEIEAFRKSGKPVYFLRWPRGEEA